MKFVYLSRHFNRSGYYILEDLIHNRKGDILGLIVPNTRSLLDHPVFAWIELLRYRLELFWYKTEDCRFKRSIVLLARRNNVPVYYVKSVKTEKFYSLLKVLSPELIVLGGGWLELLPARIIDFPKLGIINTHPSLLPEFRGGD